MRPSHYNFDRCRDLTFFIGFAASEQSSYTEGEAAALNKHVDVDLEHIYGVKEELFTVEIFYQ